jgi:hypothetical protein
MVNNLTLSPRLQKLVDLGESGTNILHGELKNLMLQAEEQLTLAQEQEDQTEEAMDSMQRTYWEGQLDALTTVYQLTYELSFAIGARHEARG